MPTSRVLRRFLSLCPRLALLIAPVLYGPADGLLLLGGAVGPAIARASFALAIASLGVATTPASGLALGQESTATVAHDTGPVPSVRAAALSSTILVDGRLDEPAWDPARPATDFTQSQPREGAPATQRTQVRFLFDDEAIYVGARMFDTLGARGVESRLVRRDRDAGSDFLSITFDTYHDHLGRSQFRINPSGVKGDALGLGGSNPDASWDPVWEAATQVDSLGWTAELRIPLSQLRFPTDSLQTWGLQIVRMVTRLNERSHWAFWGLNEVGGPSRYGHLEGISAAAQPARAEFLPYLVARSAHVEPSDPANPFRRGAENRLRLGLDLRYRLTSNLTLNATVNPDFGQVEVDPAVVNLSAFETFYPEKRPFFVEGAGFFGFGSFWCLFCSNVSSLDLFYSRRIGRPPQGAELAEDAGEFTDVPESTTILGAAKVTGRTADGWSIALLDAVTTREHAAVRGEDGGTFDFAVEPPTNYFVGRIKRDLLGGDLVVGGLATSTWRHLDSPDLSARLNRHAETAGLDAELWWGDKTYHLLASLAVSQIAGSPAAILRAQESSARYFQRPDREGDPGAFFSDAYDSTATVMRGYGAYARLARDAGDWRWETSVNLRSPGFEANDLAYLTRADYVWMNANVARSFTTPTRYYRRLNLIIGGQQQFNYDGDVTARQLQAFVGGQLPNYWNFSTFLLARPRVFDGRLTRGGPVVQRSAYRFWAFNLSTDRRKPLVLSTNPSYSWGEEGVDEYRVNLDIMYRLASNVSLTLGPSFSFAESTSQYVDAWEDPTAVGFSGWRYLFSDLTRKSLSMDTRLDVTFTPTLSLELFAQPFISSARYTRFKEFAAPRTVEKVIYGQDQGTVHAEGAGEDRRYTVDPDGRGPADSFSFEDPDFNFRSLRGNAVLRWEYRPGSTLYLVWAQDRSDTAPVGDLVFARDRAALFSADPDNIFLIKVNYWFGL